VRCEVLEKGEQSLIEKEEAFGKRGGKAGKLRPLRSSERRDIYDSDGRWTDQGGWGGGGVCGRRREEKLCRPNVEMGTASRRQ
jgi:hypothetical protein